jgi:hypothetical protein
MLNIVSKWRCYFERNHPNHTNGISFAVRWSTLSHFNQSDTQRPNISLILITKNKIESLSLVHFRKLKNKIFVYRFIVSVVRNHSVVIRIISRNKRINIRQQIIDEWCDINNVLNNLFVELSIQFLTYSGAIQYGDPTIVFIFSFFDWILETPKSVSLARPSLCNNTLAPSKKREKKNKLVRWVIF